MSGIGILGPSSCRIIFSSQIESHKTNQAYGPAQVALLEEEYEWARCFLAMRNTLPGGKTAKHFFFTSL